MGYHVIIKSIKESKNPSLVYKYIEDLKELVYIDGLQEDSIIYEGEKEWKPYTIKEHEKYKNYLDPRLRAGIKAESLFKEIAKESSIVLEKINQDEASFKDYSDVIEDSIKRGDYIARNAKNVEVEVKCLTKYNDNFYLPYHDIKKHENLQKHTKTPILFAVFQREDDKVVQDSLHMIEVKKILEENNKSVTYDETAKCLLVPVNIMTSGLELLLSFKNV